MWLKAVHFLVFTKIVLIWGYQENYVIENENSGLVMKEIGSDYEVAEWDNTKSQLWTLAPQGQPGYYIIRNVASGQEVACTADGKRYNVWKLNPAGSTMIIVEHPYMFLKQSNNEIWCAYDYPGSQIDNWVFTEQSKKISRKFVIENKKTGKVLEQTGDSLNLTNWENRDSQLWTVKPQGNGYSVVNVASGKTLTYSKHGNGYNLWKLKTVGETWIKVAGANIFLAHIGSKPVYVANQQYDDSDRWLLVDPGSKKVVTTTLASIYVKSEQKQYVIENKKSGLVLDMPRQTLELSDWDDKDSQLWTVELQNSPGYYILRNVASGSGIQCTVNGSSYSRWKLNTQNYTRIEVNNPYIFLKNDGGILKCFNTKQNDESDIWIFIERSKKINMKFTIENKKTGEVLEEAGEILKMGKWEDKNSQLWTIKPKNQSGYLIVNVASGKFLSYSADGNDYDLWKLKTVGDTWIQIAGANIFLAHKGTKPVYVEKKQDDDSDRWLVNPSSKKITETSVRIYVEPEQKQYMIKNKKSELFLDMPRQTLELSDWDDKNSQLWTLEPQKRLGYYILRNVASGEILAYSKDNRSYQVVRLNKHGYTWILIEDINVFLTDLDGDVDFIGHKRYGGSDKWLLIEK